MKREHDAGWVACFEVLTHALPVTGTDDGVGVADVAQYLIGLLPAHLYGRARTADDVRGAAEFLRYLADKLDEQAGGAL